jgi:acyl phosphate:glycerol-3-phosphate acyltransferase
MIFLLPLMFGYVLGSIPFGLLLTRAAGLGDIRAIGSGNIGATNVLRTGKRGLAAATLVLDVAKGLLAVVVAASFAPGLGLVAGLGAMLGHAFPVWLRFRGGKGIATGFGVLLGAVWWLGLAAAVAWGVAVVVTRISSVGALAACGAAVLAATLAGDTPLMIFTAALAALVIWRHRPNIARLRAGTEPRIGR